MTRRDALINIVPDESIDLVNSVIDDVALLAERLTELKGLPFIEVNTKNPMKQRSTPSSKLYKEFLQQYVNCIKMIEYVIYKDQRLEGDEVEESPLRKWLKENANTRKENIHSI